MYDVWRLPLAKPPSYLHKNINYFFFVDVRVAGLEDCWEGVLGDWGECGCVVDAWEVGLFDMLVLTGLSAGVWDSVGVKALARDADRSRARIFSRACLRSVSAWMALSSAAWARSSVSLWKDVNKVNRKHSNPYFKMNNLCIKNIHLCCFSDPRSPPGAYTKISMFPEHYNLETFFLMLISKWTYKELHLYQTQPWLSVHARALELNKPSSYYDAFWIL